MRTALTSASCARGRDRRPAVELMARAASGTAPASASSRRVLRVAYANDGTEPEGEWHEAGAWLGSALDLALLELESPFESSAHARPILMATTVEECSKAPPCHVVRTPSGPGALRVALVTPAQGATCGAVAHHWSAIAEGVMCLTGPELCPNDWGAGVVCAGKLCGVMSRSARAVSGGDKNTLTEGGGGGMCGRIHVAQSMARWRNFLHCAHTLRACGRDNCATQCSERQLVEPPKVSGGGFPFDGEPERTTVEETTTTTETSAESTTTPSLEPQNTAGRSIVLPPVGRARAQAPPPLRTEDNAGAPPAAGDPPVRRLPFEFEPGRADFKAGEYGDNAADYGDGEEGPTRTPSQTPPARTVTLLPAARVAPPSPAVTMSTINLDNETYQYQSDETLGVKNGAASISKPFVSFLMFILHM